MIRRVQHIFRKAFRETEAASVRHLQSSPPDRLDLTVVVSCVVAALCLTMAYYAGQGAVLESFARRSGQGLLNRWVQGDPSLAAMVWWALGVILFYLVVPLLTVKFVFRQSPRQYGFRLRGAFDDAPVYLAAAAVIVPVVVMASASPGFLDRYPFCQVSQGEGLWPRFVGWEAVYLLQFVAVEFFFRGFLLHATKRRFGFYSVFIVMIPYCMVHFSKPLPETLAAIGAGVVLGVFSLKTGSILPGCLLHCGTALTMDLAALWRKGLLIWPWG